MSNEIGTQTDIDEIETEDTGTQTETPAGTMLGNIKMLLGIDSSDGSKDFIINYWIKFYERMVLKYCHLTELNEDIELLIEQMVIMKMGGVGSGGEGEEVKPDGVKSITRGDYQIVYFGGDEKGSSGASHNVLDEIAINYMGQLNLWRRLDY